ncbi:MAG: hypothetical protein QOG53_1833 [Frankiales bacterium]|nr:hypothetical protein [Frankiales bacterium]
MTTLAASSTAGLSTAAVATRHWQWIYRLRTDLLLSLCWVPAFLFMHRLSTTHTAGGDALLRNVVTWTLILSLLHQPLTLLVIYGDAKQFELRRRLFSWSPVVAVSLVVVAVYLDLWIVVPIAAIWNTVHTVQQRYGLCRIYSRKAGYGSARLDRVLLFSWIGLAIVAAGAATSTTDQLSRVSLGATNADAVTTLTRIQPYALWLLIPVGLVAFGSLVAVARQEWRHRDRANHAKWLYQGATLALIIGIAVDPLAGLVAWVFAHTVEYVVVVQRTMVTRYGGATPDRSTLGRAARGRRRWTLLATFLVCALFVDVVLQHRVPTHIYLTVIYTLGLLHFWYDAFIWKVRKPAVAADFGIRPAT